ncbi:MAG: HAMP domain-containing sensor histidine kinase [Nitrospirota bacterium]
MIFRSLYAKLAAVLLGLFLIMGATIILAGVYSTEMYQQEVNQRLNREIARLIVNEKIVIRDNKINEDALKDIFHMLMVINPTIEVYLLDPEGNILSYSAEPGKVKRKSVDLGPIKKFLEGSVMFPLTGDDPRDAGREKVFSAARIPETGKLDGYLYVILGGETYDNIIQKLQRSYIFRITTWGVIASLAVSMFAALIIFASLTRRLRRLASAMDDYKEGTPPSGLDLPAVKSGKGDEIDRLVSAFSQMAGQIRDQLDSLKNADSLRRELVANVSHDLRTPLATLQGYIETLIMKEGSLSREERRSYLEIAVNHCKRLSKMVSELIELAKLEARETALQPEPFSAGELVQDVVQKFRLSVEAKKINITTNIGRELPFVYADIALIERALENLLENSLRHTPDNGSVSVILDLQGENVLVRVSNTGEGIPHEELPRIFDRFYQLSRSRKDRNGHSGLGLAVTKRILELHGSGISVESRLGVGTTFTFSLPVHRKI